MKYVCLLALSGLLSIAAIWDYSPVNTGIVQVETVKYVGTLNAVEVPTSSPRKSFRGAHLHPLDKASGILPANYALR